MKKSNTKVIIFDSGTVINFAMNGLLYLLPKLKDEFGGKFLITERVKKEIIDRPSHIKRYELEALMIKKLFDEGVIELPYELVKREEVFKKRDELLDFINHSYHARGEFINLLHEGEASVLALSILLNKQKIKNAVSIDERTARMLCENPENLKKIFEEKLHTNVELKKDLGFLNKIRVIRSSELLYTAYKKGLVDIKDGNVLEALLYAVKYRGCSISFEEIEQMKRI